jgi:hypothetical protein
VSTTIVEIEVKASDTDLDLSKTGGVDASLCMQVGPIRVWFDTDAQNELCEQLRALGVIPSLTGTAF